MGCLFSSETSEVFAHCKRGDVAAVQAALDARPGVPVNTADRVSE
jgi:hypothetical protein